MSTVTSKDGTTIAFDRVGEGPPVILVHGATMYRGIDPSMPQLAELLAPHFTVYYYDRRGRGDSGDTPPYAVEREVEDIEALIDRAGGSAYVYGISSGAALAMETALGLGNKVRKLAMYEAPYNSEDSYRQAWKEYRQQLRQLLAAGRNGDALAAFMRLVGMPDEGVEEVRQDAFWPVLEAVGPTLAYDAAIMGDEAAVPTERAARVAVPALVMNGEAGFPFMAVTARALARAMPDGRYHSLPGQDHNVAPEAIAPVLDEFFSS